MIVLVPLTATVIVQAAGQAIGQAIGWSGWGWLFVPQGVSYLCLAAWAVTTGATLREIGLRPPGRETGRAVLWGGLTGIGTGAVNLFVIVKVTPWLGGSAAFLRDTPHAHMPPVLMLTVGIPLIAGLVELNFRGFILGRLLDLFRVFFPSWRAGPAAAIGLSALAFSYDPFMTTVFRVYHWLALSDGLIWGWLYYATGHLAATITAHAVEVLLVYSALKFWYA